MEITCPNQWYIPAMRLHLVVAVQSVTQPKSARTLEPLPNSHLYNTLTTEIYLDPEWKGYLSNSTILISESMPHEFHLSSESWDDIVCRLCWLRALLPELSLLVRTEVSLAHYLCSLFLFSDGHRNFPSLGSFVEVQRKLLPEPMVLSSDALFKPTPLSLPKMKFTSIFVAAGLAFCQVCNLWCHGSDWTVHWLITIILGCVGRLSRFELVDWTQLHWQ